MKWIPRQSKCPYCSTVYRYGDLKKLKYKKSAECYHCGRDMKVSRSGWLILALELIAVYAVFNILSILLLKNLSFGLLFLINLIPTAAAVLLLPLYLTLVIKGTSDDSLKKNTNE